MEIEELKEENQQLGEMNGKLIGHLNWVNSLCKKALEELK